MSEYIINDNTYNCLTKSGSILVEGEIIRCKNCKHGFKDGSKMYCRRWVKSISGEPIEIEFVVKPNDFCSSAERDV